MLKTQAIKHIYMVQAISDQLKVLHLDESI
jgi:hypothetical protein